MRGEKEKKDRLDARGSRSALTRRDGWAGCVNGGWVDGLTGGAAKLAAV